MKYGGNDMKIYESIVTCMVKKTHHHLKNQELLGKLINYSMQKDVKLNAFHKEKGYKYYNFQTLYPMEPKGYYIEGKVYLFRIRSIRSDFLKLLQRHLKNGNEDFDVLSIEAKELKVKHITELKTITPTIVTIDGKPWMKDDGIIQLGERIHANLEKKYNAFYDKNERFEPFIQRIEVLSKNPVATHYKGVKLLGHKVKLFVNEDERSQMLAKMAIGTSIGEKGSSLGSGYALFYS